MSHAGANERKPKPVDIRAGRRIRIRRAEIGMTQQQLAARAGITFQQVQKYERGTNRMSLSRACELCEILEIGIDYLIRRSLPRIPLPPPTDTEGR